MKALITGSAGFIGQHLVSELTRNNYHVVGFDKKQGDIVSFNLDKVLGDIDVVFHLAGLLGTSELFHRIIDAEKVNVLGTLNLLESMRRNDVNRIVFTSKPNIWPYNVYTITKENCERYLEMYREIYGFKVVICRPYNVYGPGEYLSEYRKAIPYFIIAALRNESLEVFGDGSQTMDAVHVDDVVTALRLCAEKTPEGIVKIGSGTAIAVKSLAEIIIRLTESKSTIVHKPWRRGEKKLEWYEAKICADDSMERLLGFKVRTGLEEGLRLTIDWYREHLDEFSEIYIPRKEDFLQ